MKTRGLAAALVLGAAASLIAAAPQNSSRPGRAGDTRAVFTPDKGEFRILLDGTEIGTEEFEFSPAGNTPAGGSATADIWIARGETVIRTAGNPESHSSGQLRIRADGVPLHYQWSSQDKAMASGTVDFDNGTAKASVTLGSKDPVREDFKFTSPRVTILDNNLFDQYGMLGRLYDWNAKGVQTFPILIPQDMTPGTIDVESIDADALRARTTDREIDLYFDARRRLIRLEVPAARVVVVRQ